MKRVAKEGMKRGGKGRGEESGKGRGEKAPLIPSHIYTLLVWNWQWTIR